MEENKPLEADPEAQEGVETPTPEEGGKEDVSEEQVVDFKSKLEEISGREFKDENDAIKHYENLKSFVGKKQEESAPKEEKKEGPQGSGDIKQVIERLDRNDFLSDNPDAKDHYDSLVKPLSEAKNVPLADAWGEVQPLIEAQQKRDEQKEIGITSKNRVQPASKSEVADLQKRARQGDTLSQEKLLEAALGKQM